MWWNTLPKGEEKAEVLNAIFASVCNSKTSCSPGTQIPELEERDGEQKEDSIIQGEMVSNLLHCLDMQNTVGLDKIYLRIWRELVKVLTELLSIIYQLCRKVLERHLLQAGSMGQGQLHEIQQVKVPGPALGS